MAYEQDSMTKEQLDAHKSWVETRFNAEPQGQRLVMIGADLRSADLLSANLSGANLRDADLRVPT